MKILFIITKSNWGGAQRYVYDLATSLLKRDHSVVVALGGTGETGAGVGALGTRLSEAGIPLRHLVYFSRAVGLMREIRVARELFDTIRAEQPDVVHLNSSKAAGLGAVIARLCGVPRIVFTIHGFPFTEQRPWYQRILIDFFTWITLLLVTDVICICTPDRLRAEKMWGVRNKLHFIPNGIEEQIGLPSKIRSRAILAEMAPALVSVLQDIPWIATGTELAPRKGIDDVIAACAQMRADVQQFHLVVIGTGEQRHELAQQVERLELTEHATFAGFVPNLAEHLTSFDAFVLASHKEGLPYILLEVARAEVPIVTSNIDGIPDIIRDQTEGMLIAPGNPDEIAAALRDTLSNPNQARERAEVLAQKVRDRFSLTRMTDETLAVYIPPLRLNSLR